MALLRIKLGMKACSYVCIGIQGGKFRDSCLSLHFTDDYGKSRCGEMCVRFGTLKKMRIV